MSIPLDEARKKACRCAVHALNMKDALSFIQDNLRGMPKEMEPSEYFPRMPLDKIPVRESLRAADDLSLTVVEGCNIAHDDLAEGLENIRVYLTRGEVLKARREIETLKQDLHGALGVCGGFGSVSPVGDWVYKKWFKPDSI